MRAMWLKSWMFATLSLKSQWTHHDFLLGVCTDPFTAASVESHDLVSCDPWLSSASALLTPHGSKWLPCFFSVGASSFLKQDFALCILRMQTQRPL